MGTRIGVVGALPQREVIAVLGIQVGGILALPGGAVVTSATLIAASAALPELCADPAHEEQPALKHRFSLKNFMRWFWKRSATALVWVPE